MDRILYPLRRPNLLLDAAMPVDYPLNTMLAQTFGAWSATRVGRFLEVNPRTVQRWLKDGGHDMGSVDLPADLRDKIVAQHALVIEHKPLETIEEYVEEMRDEKGIHPEVLAAHLAVVYRHLTGREIE
jgi:hypothetical protein